MPGRPARRSAKPAAAAPARRAASGPDRGEAPWRRLVELADLMGQHVYPIDALLDVGRWLADATGADVSIILLASSGVDEVVAWPPDTDLAVELAGLAGRPLDPASGLWAAVCDGQTVAADAGDPMLLPAGVTPDGIGATAAVPLVGGDMTFGVLLVHQGDEERVPNRDLALVEQVAPRLGLALANAEQLAPVDAADEAPLVDLSFATLAAVAVLLGSVDSLPAPVAPDGPAAGGYDEITRRAAELADLVEQFLDETTG